MTDDRAGLTSEEWCGVDQPAFRDFVARLREAHDDHDQNPLMLRDDVRRVFKRFLQSHAPDDRRQLRETLGRRIDHAEEVIFYGDHACLVLREEAGRRRVYDAGPNGDGIRVLDERQYLGLRESIVLGGGPSSSFEFGIDFRPFSIFPTESGRATDIGSGIERVAELLEEEVRSDPQRVLARVIDFISGRTDGGEPILFTEKPEDVPALRTRLSRALRLLGRRPDETAIDDLLADLELLGFAPGWGSTVGRARRTLGLLDGLLRDPTGGAFQQLCERLPLVRNVVLASVHGWFAQADVLGRPDTGGQVVYVLDQARALERHIRQVWTQAGLSATPKVIILTRLIPDADGTTSDQPREPVQGSEFAEIVRVPFRNAEGEVERQWISRFQVWPYLDEFSKEALGELETVFRGDKADLIVGNYSDGNTVAALLGRVWQVPIAIIAHALEKTKYLLSDLYWRDLEEDYHFSIHYLSDILAASSADFIITSSFQEIAGTEGEMGQYESYQVFTLPGRYRVLSGVNIRSARFVIDPPGVDTDRFFPPEVDGDEGMQARRRIEELVFADPPPDEAIRGRFDRPDLPLLFTMARMDKIKNLTGLVQAYGKRTALRDSANLLILSGVTDYDASTDHEERQQITKMYKVLDQYDLHGCVRWLPGSLGQELVPHYYRFVASRRGVFIQPALFEAFGLTVLESMASGLPVVATRFGGPASIIEDGVSGFLVDPNRAADLERAVLSLVGGSEANPHDVWARLSAAGIERVRTHFSWPGHASRLAVAQALYGLWNHIFPERRKVRHSYVDALYHLLYKRLVADTWPDH